MNDVVNEAISQGSVFKRKDGRWCAEVTLGTNGDGKRLKRIRYATTREEAIGKLDELRQEVKVGTDVNAGREKLGKYIETWIAAKADLKPSTIANYEDLLRLHVQPYPLAGKQLAKVQPAHVEAWLATLRTRKVGARTRQAAYALVRGALKKAVRQNIVPFSAAERVDPPKVTQSERVVLDHKHVQALIETARGSDFEALILLAVAHGPRLGELLGLQWADIDMDGGVLQVRRQLSEVRRKGCRELTSLKTQASRRNLPLSQLALDGLRRHRARVAAKRMKRNAGPIPDDMLVFTDRSGSPLRRSNFHRRVWIPLRNAAKLPKGTRFHDLRHAAASSLLAGGMDIATVGGVLGHASAATTLRVYTHALPSKKKEAASRIDEMFGINEGGAR